eukprot:scaffold11639_cov172-Amphora_coffeaeformis.AAC.28
MMTYKPRLVSYYGCTYRICLDYLMPLQAVSRLLQEIWKSRDGLFDNIHIAAETCFDKWSLFLRLLGSFEIDKIEDDSILLQDLLSDVVYGWCKVCSFYVDFVRSTELSELYNESFLLFGTIPKVGLNVCMRSNEYTLHHQGAALPASFMPRHSLLLPIQSS